MTTVRELIKHLVKFSKDDPEHGDAEIMLVYDGGVAMEFSRADKVMGMGQNGDKTDLFLVFTPDLHGKRLKFDVKSVN